MTNQFTFTAEIERDDDMIEVEVSYSVTPFIPAQTYGPAELCHPAEGGECEIVSATIGGCEIPLSDTEESEILRQCEERARDDLAAEAAAEEDWRYEQYRDRQMRDAWEARA